MLKVVSKSYRRFCCMDFLANKMGCRGRIRIGYRCHPGRSGFWDIPASPGALLPASLGAGAVSVCEAVSSGSRPGPAA